MDNRPTLQHQIMQAKKDAEYTEKLLHPISDSEFWWATHFKPIWWLWYKHIKHIRP